MDRGELPETVRLPDGRTEPFEPERITRALFAAGERIGRSDAFLARELTDGVLHFLATEDVGAEITPDRIAEVVGKVVRELGQPALAKAFETRSARKAPPNSTTSPWPNWLRPALTAMSVERAAAHETIRAFGLSRLFPRDLLSAHIEGLIWLSGLTTPLELDGLCLPLPPGRVLETIRQARDVAGEFLSVDGPEYDLAALPGEPRALADAFVREAAFAAEALGLRLVLNLNIATPPGRLAAGTGPLFALDAEELSGRREEISAALADWSGEAGLTIWWHVHAVQANDQLTARLSRSLGDRNLEFVFDRPRAPVLLGPGIDRQTPATLIQVGVNLARLVELTGTPPLDPEVFLSKVGSLTRFAKTAGHVKQDFLRRHARPAVWEAFLLDRARLVLIPLGLAEAAEASDRGDFAGDILRAMRTAAETDRPRVLPVQIDSHFDNDATIPTALVPQRKWAYLAGRFDLPTPAGVLEAIESLQKAADAGVSRVRFLPA